MQYSERIERLICPAQLFLFLISSLNKHSFFQSVIGKELCFGHPKNAASLSSRDPCSSFQQDQALGQMVFSSRPCKWLCLISILEAWVTARHNYRTVVGLHSLQCSSGKVIALCTSTVQSRRGNTVPVHNVSPRTRCSHISILFLYFMLNGLRSRVQDPNLLLSWLKVF